MRTNWRSPAAPMTAHRSPDIWMHNGFLSMGGSDKMSKSLGNVVGVDELLAQGGHDAEDAADWRC